MNDRQSFVFYYYNLYKSISINKKYNLNLYKFYNINDIFLTVD